MVHKAVSLSWLVEEPGFSLPDLLQSFQPFIILPFPPRPRHLHSDLGNHLMNRTESNKPHSTQVCQKGTGFICVAKGLNMTLKGQAIRDWDPSGKTDSS